MSKRNIREIRQLSLDGHLITVYENVKGAAAAVGVAKSSIRNIFYGYNKTAAGYKWEAVYCQPTETKRVIKSEDPSKVTEKEERVIVEFLEEINSNTTERRCIGIDSDGNFCNKEFLSTGRHERKCRKCRKTHEGTPPHRTFISKEYAYLLQHEELL